MDDSATNTATSMQDGAWSAVILKPIEAPIPNPCDWDDSHHHLDEMPEEEDDPYLDEMPKDTDASCTSPRPVAHAYVTTTLALTNDTTSELYDSGATRHIMPYQKALVN